MKVKNIFFPAASIIKIFILLFLLTFSSKSEENESKFFSNDKGILSIMYHRFDEIKYPSTNIRMEIFKKQMDIISEKNVRSIRPGFGLHPKYFPDVLGKRFKENIEKGTRFNLDFMEKK